MGSQTLDRYHKMIFTYKPTVWKRCHVLDILNVNLWHLLISTGTVCFAEMRRSKTVSVWKISEALSFVRVHSVKKSLKYLEVGLSQ